MKRRRESVCRRWCLLVRGVDNMIEESCRGRRRVEGAVSSSVWTYCVHVRRQRGTGAGDGRHTHRAENSTPHFFTEHPFTKAALPEANGGSSDRRLHTPGANTDWITAEYIDIRGVCAVLETFDALFLQEMSALDTLTFIEKVELTLKNNVYLAFSLFEWYLTKN